MYTLLLYNGIWLLCFSLAGKNKGLSDWVYVWEIWERRGQGWTYKFLTWVLMPFIKNKQHPENRFLFLILSIFYGKHFFLCILKTFPKFFCVCVWRWYCLFILNRGKVQLQEKVNPKLVEIMKLKDKRGSFEGGGSLMVIYCN